MANPNFDHHRAVEEFFRQKREEDPARVADVFDRYPTLNYRQMQQINRTERPSGLVGTTQARVAVGVAMEYGLPIESGEGE